MVATDAERNEALLNFLVIFQHFLLNNSLYVILSLK